MVSKQKNKKSICKAYGSICLILVLLLSVCACQNKQTNQEDNKDTAPKTALTMPINKEGGLDIYTTKSRVNITALSLCYSALFYLDKNFTPKPDLAQSYVLTGNTASITISDDAVFSDGTKVTAADCKYSYDRAKSEGNYTSIFTNIQSYAVISEREFQVVFHTENQYNINLLYIPITKQGTITNNTSFAIGAGKYYIKTAPGEESKDILGMFPNNYRSDMEECGIKQITLKQYADISDILYGINYGDIDIMTADLSDGATSYRGDIELQSYSNNALTFFVLNKDRKWATNYESVSRGFHCGINRQQLYANVIKGCGTVCWYPLNPDWTETIAADLNDDIYDSDTAKTEFYNGRLYISAAGKLQWYGEDINLNIVVNRESDLRIKIAEELAQQLQIYGFNTYVTQLSWSDYLKAIQEKNFDIYIGEVQIPYNMDLSGLFTAANVPIGEELQNALTAFQNGQTDIRTLLSAFNNEIPLIPLYYNHAALATNREIQGTFSPSATLPFGGIESWSYK